MLTVHYGSTATLVATLTDSAGDPVTGAAVTVSIVDRDGTAVVTDQAMEDQGDGTYEYEVAADALSSREGVYRAQVTAVLDQQTRFAEIRLLASVDVT